MRIDIISVLPKLIESPFNASILKRAIDKKLIEVNFHDLKDYASSKRRQVDDYHLNLLHASHISNSFSFFLLY